MTLNLKLALLGLVTLSAAITLPGCQSNKCCGEEKCAAECADKCEKAPVALADLPAAVTATANREAPGGRIVEAEKCSMNGKTCYCVEVEHNGQEWELCIDADGTLTKKELER